MQKDYSKATCDEIMDEVDRLTVELKRTVGLMKNATSDEEVDVITAYYDMLRCKVDGLLRLYKFRALYEAICNSH